MTNIYYIETEAVTRTVAGKAETQELVSRKLKQGAKVTVYLIGSGQDVTGDFV